MKRSMIFEVHCWYSKKTAVNDLKTEYTMKLIIKYIRIAYNDHLRPFPDVY